MYNPPFSISSKAINLIAKISAQIERYAIRMEQSDSLKLRTSLKNFAQRMFESEE